MSRRTSGSSPTKKALYAKQPAITINNKTRRLLQRLRKLQKTKKAVMLKRKYEIKDKDVVRVK